MLCVLWVATAGCCKSGSLGWASACFFFPLPSLTPRLLSAFFFAADADRFHSDVSGEELLLRQQKHAHKQQIYDQKRIDAAVREEERWKRIEEVKAAEEEYWKQQRALGHKVGRPPARRAAEPTDG